MLFLKILAREAMSETPRRQILITAGRSFYFQLHKSVHLTFLVYSSFISHTFIKSSYSLMNIYKEPFFFYQ